MKIIFNSPEIDFDQDEIINYLINNNYKLYKLYINNDENNHYIICVPYDKDHLLYDYSNSQLLYISKKLNNKLIEIDSKTLEIDSKIIFQNIPSTYNQYSILNIFDKNIKQKYNIYIKYLMLDKARALNLKSLLINIDN